MGGAGIQTPPSRRRKITVGMPPDILSAGRRTQPIISSGTNMDRGWQNVTSSSTRIIMA